MLYQRKLTKCHIFKQA